MKQAKSRITLEAINDIMLMYTANIKITDIIRLNDDEFMLTVEGDGIPDDADGENVCFQYNVEDAVVINRVVNGVQTSVGYKTPIKVGIKKQVVK